MSAFYVGASAELLVNLAGRSRFFYALRRNDDGEIFFARVDQLIDQDSIEINEPGDPSKNYPDFEEGFDFYNGRDSEHNLIYDNLKYEQYRWDYRTVYYYIDDQGQLVQRSNQSYPYPANISSEG